MVVTQTDTFSAWLKLLRDDIAFAAIVTRLRRLANDDNPGDSKVFGGIVELRIDVGAGYRVYLMRDDTGALILTGGDKSSQSRDIPKARALAAEVVRQRKDAAPSSAKKTPAKPKGKKQR